MFKRELMKIGVVGAIGLILGILLAVNTRQWFWALLCILYAIGFFYGGKFLIVWVGKVFGAWFLGLFRGGMAGFFAKTILMAIGIGVLAAVGWLVGCVMAVRALYTAYGQDAAMGYVGGVSQRAGGRAGGRVGRIGGKKRRDTLSGANNGGVIGGGDAPGGYIDDFGFDTPAGDALPDTQNKPGRRPVKALNYSNAPGASGSSSGSGASGGDFDF